MHIEYFGVPPERAVGECEFAGAAFLMDYFLCGGCIDVLREYGEIKRREAGG